MTAISTLQEVALEGASGSADCESLSDQMMSTYYVPGTVQATGDVKMKAVGDRTHKRTGLPPD